MKQDRQDVIKKAMELFWQKGFHATSMRNIQEVIDMRPGSIYASFGSKEGLFTETLTYYAEAGLANLSALAQECSSPLEGLKAFIRKSMTSCGSAPSAMCMLVKSISELTAEDNAELLLESQRLLHVFEDAFAALLIEAQACGELSASKDPKRLARLLQVQLMGFRSYMCAHGGHVPVEELLEDTFSCLS